MKNGDIPPVNSYDDATVDIKDFNKDGKDCFDIKRYLIFKF